jgi:hypothetical protein
MVLDDFQLLEDDAARQLFAAVEPRRAVESIAQPILERRVNTDGNDAIDVESIETNDSIRSS